MQALLKGLQNEAHILQHIYGELARINYLKNLSSIKTTLQVNTAQAQSLCSLGRNTASWGHFHVSLSSPNDFHVQHFHNSFLLTQKPSKYKFNWLMFFISVPLPSKEWKDFPGCPVKYVWNILPNSACPAFFKSCLTIFFSFPYIQPPIWTEKMHMVINLVLLLQLFIQPWPFSPFWFYPMLYQPTTDFKLQGQETATFNYLYITALPVIFRHFEHLFFKALYT